MPSPPQLQLLQVTKIQGVILSMYRKRNPNFVHTSSAQRTIHVTFSVKTVDLYLISEKSIWKNQVWQTGSLVYLTGMYQGSKIRGGQVVMQRAAAARRRLLICQNLGGSCPPCTLAASLCMWVRVGVGVGVNLDNTAVYNTFKPKTF